MTQMLSCDARFTVIRGMLTELCLTVSAGVQRFFLKDEFGTTRSASNTILRLKIPGQPRDARE